MKIRRIFSLIAIPLLLTSCSSGGDHYLMMNMDTYFSKSYIKSYKQAEIDSLIQSNNEFILYLSSYGCSSCSAVYSALKSYIPTNRVLVYNLDNDFYPQEVELLVAKYPEMFKKEFPSVYMVKGLQATQMSTSKMDSSSRIGNAFSSVQHISYLYYSNQDIMSSIALHPDYIPYKTFGYVGFDFNNKTLLNSYTKHLSNDLETTKNCIILNNYHTGVDSIIIGSYNIDENGNVNCINEITTNDFANIDLVKEILKI